MCHYNPFNQPTTTEKHYVIKKEKERKRQVVLPIDTNNDVE